MPDPYAISAGLYDKLANEAALVTELGGTAIYEMVAPKSQALPFLIFQWQGGGDENLTPSRSLNEVWTVKGVSESLSKAKAIAADIDTALHDQALTVSGWINFWMAREQTLRFTELDDEGKDIWHIGAQYRIMLGN